MLNSVLAIWTLLAADSVTYLGRQVTVVDRGTDDLGFPKGEAKVCVEGQDVKDCYTAPEGFGRVPSLSVVELRKGEQALFFETATGGVSGWSIHFALLTFCDRNRSPWCKVDELKDLLPREFGISNQSQHDFWELPEISDSKIFLTATFVWGPREAHYSDHRYIVSVYARRPDDFDGLTYYLVDRFMTVRTYGYKNDDLEDVLGAEKREILARLRRVKTSWPNVTKASQPKR
jgi:hypothetical protein